ncbi:hypothetical protein ES707_11779 [subsurface metagenome]
MGLAAMIIGIVAVILGIIPGCGLVFGLPPAIVGLILGIVDVRKKSKAKQPKGTGMAGVVLNAVAIVFIIVWTLVIAAAPKAIESIEDANVPPIEQPVGQ